MAIFKFLVVNTSGIDVDINDLGVTVANTETVDLSEGRTRVELSQSTDLRTAVNDSNFKRRNNGNTLDILAADAFVDVDILTGETNIFQALINSPTTPTSANPFVTNTEADTLIAAATALVTLDDAYNNDTDGVLLVNGGGAKNLIFRMSNTTDFIVDEGAGNNYINADSTANTLFLGDLSALIDVEVARNLTVQGNLSVNGTLTTINTTNTTITDNIIIYNQGEVGAGVTAGSAGIQIDRGTLTDSQLLWDEVGDRWQAGIVGTLSDILLFSDFTTSGGDAGTATTVARGDHIHDARYFTETELGSVASGQGASLIGVQDLAGNFTGVNVEAVLAELFSLSGATPTIATQENGVSVDTVAETLNFVNGIVATDAGLNVTALNLDYSVSAPSALSGTGVIGTANSISRSDHQHPMISLDNAYDGSGGAGAGRTISTDSGPVVLDRVAATTPSLRIVPHATTPSGTPNDGDVAIVGGIMYAYDSSRTKWLSVSRKLITFTNRGATDNQYLRYGTISHNAVGAEMVRNGTVVGVTADSSGGLATKGFQIRAEGVSVDSFNLTAGEFLDAGRNINFSAGQRLQLRAVAAGGVVRNPSITLEIAWRLV